MRPGAQLRHPADGSGDRRERELLIYDHPTAGKVRTVNPGARFSETPAKMWRMPPKLGEHTEEILRESGIERTQVEELRAAKVIN